MSDLTDLLTRLARLRAAVDDAVGQILRDDADADVSPLTAIRVRLGELNARPVSEPDLRRWFAEEGVDSVNEALAAWDLRIPESLELQELKKPQTA